MMICKVIRIELRFLVQSDEIPKLLTISLAQEIIAFILSFVFQPGE